ncbi:hypothetical protein COCSUDRAFT_46483 [Coccomyxa subellipsoidea C-169]|uniref:CTLH domain-containing protein n=1 Tax=Coccomyxa subellipsoidea (strain C-169) TaxID=574566 RepID=I0Z612_COCSC|nr:hypothetical protein COCSUDRAFT_46483 [Coccomyxa subellipsoidea C-169]EIE26081.1 hypothetical protein COCSUDRAFT_46483 [Coccomyxa subellipsoidea C-169]|eukprot:XP_005650625.1 hypothetical protein COCSUDRAFT_46483 [Coccomyxa subellipsoidea C-169]
MVELKTKNGQPEVNLVVLDRLVQDYMVEEDLVDEEGTSMRAEGSAPATPPSANNALRALCESVRQCTEAGILDDAVRLAESVNLTVFQDSRLLFRVLKQEFVEHLRSNTEDGRKTALECVRKKLAPLALNAYPEAYAEFKRALLLLVYSQHEDVSPVASEWSARTRADLAAILSRTLRQAAGIQFPKLALLLRYLVFTHRLLKTQADGSARPSGTDCSPEVEELLGKLLSDERDPPPFPPEFDPLSGQGFPEADIQSLKEAVQLSRQEAVEALRHTKGDVQKAFINELASMHLNVALVDDLVLAYAAHRDLLRVGSSTESSPTHSTGAQKAGETCSATDMDIDGQARREAKQDASASGLEAAMEHEAVRGRLEGERQDVTAAFNRHPSKSPPKKVARWRGRSGRRRPSPRAPENSAASPPRSNGASPQCGNGVGGRESGWHKVAQLGQAGSAKPFEVDFRHELVKRVRRKIEAESFQEAMDDMRVVAPGCLEGDVELLFELQLACFYKLAAEGRTAEAIRLSRSHLTPLTQDQPHLVPQVKAALARAVADPGEVRACLRPVWLSQLAASRMQQVLDIREPQLVQLLRVLVASHKAWLKLQRCKDRFEPLLSLDALKSCSEKPSSAAAATASTGAAVRDNSTAAGSGGDGNGEHGRQGEQAPAQRHTAAATDSDDEGPDGAYSEDDIVLIMEFASLGRAAAIELLQDFGGDTESVLANMYLALVPLAFVVLASCASAADNIDLPVATGGFEQWAGVVGKAMSFGGKNQGESLQALKSFQGKVMANMQKQSNSFKKLTTGDFSDVLSNLLKNKVQISAPVFFNNAPAVIAKTFAAVQFGFTGIGYAPCAVPIVPTGVGVFPQGINIQPEFFNIAPTGVNVQPQGLSISPNLIVIGPYDTTVAGQGLNIAPALIAIAPVKTVVNPVGPLAIADTLVSVALPALP